LEYVWSIVWISCSKSPAPLGIFKARGGNVTFAEVPAPFTVDPFLSECPNIVGAALDATLEAEQELCFCLPPSGLVDDQQQQQQQQQRFVPQYRLEVVDDETPTRTTNECEHRSSAPIATNVPNTNTASVNVDDEWVRNCNGCDLCIGKRVVIIWPSRSGPIQKSYCCGLRRISPPVE
jgi:hypothetical protein